MFMIVVRRSYGNGADRDAFKIVGIVQSAWQVKTHPAWACLVGKRKVGPFAVTTGIYMMVARAESMLISPMVNLIPLDASTILRKAR
jgi:hypothetical protein